jgi:hypothetical protein
MTASRPLLLPFASAFVALMAALPAQAQAQAQQARPGAASNPTAATRPAAAAPAGTTRPAAAAPRPNAAASQARPAAGSGAGRAAAAGAAGAAAGAGATAAASRPGSHQAVLLGTFNDWKAYSTQAGRSKVCYALSEPKERLPRELKRDPAFIFVSFRPSENVRNEVAVVLGFPTKDGSEAKAAVGSAQFDFLTKDQNAWIKNPAQEEQVVQTLSRGGNLVLRSQSRRGNELTDRYSLQGFAQALERARRECQQG